MNTNMYITILPPMIFDYRINRLPILKAETAGGRCDQTVSQAQPELI